MSAGTTVRFDDDRPPSESVVMAVSSHLDRDPTELRPLFDTVDPEALDALCGPGPRERVSVSFEYSLCRVVVADGKVHVECVET